MYLAGVEGGQKTVRSADQGIVQLFLHRSDHSDAHHLQPGIELSGLISYLPFMPPTDWEAKYQSGDMPWEKGAPSPGLVDFLAAHTELPKGTVCVPGCGTGHDVVAWAEAGFQTTGYDIASSAVRLTQARIDSEGVKARIRQLNFLTDEPPEKFDWIFEHTLFCAIDPEQRHEYVQAVLRWLKPDGSYLAVNYLIPDTDGPPFGTTRDELWKRFSTHFDLIEEKVPRSYPNRTGFELLLWWRRKG